MGTESLIKTEYDQYFGKEHDAVRKAVRDFVKKEIKPYVDDWEEAEAFPKELYKKIGELGFHAIGYPEEYGGTPGDIFLGIAVAEELCRCGSMGVVASLGSLHISVPPIKNHGTEEQKQKFLKPVLEGDRISALGITEPSGGSDVASLKTTAERDGDHYVVNGSKTFITSATKADQITCAVRTGGEGAHGVSLLIIETDTPGFNVAKKIKKTGWRASDTAELFFDNCRVPVTNLIGEENKGFYYIMENFQSERLQLCIMANMTSQICLEECLKYVKEREAFGKSLSGFQVLRHKLADMATMAEASREFTYRVGDATQIFGGYGFTREYLVERLYRDNRILSIGGGTTEIMKEIISKLIL